MVACAALAASAIGAALVGGPAAASAAHKRKLSPPKSVNAYPLLADTSAALQVEAEQDACNFAQAQAPRGNSLLILAFRRAHKKGDEYGVGADTRNSPFFSNEVDVRAALEAAGEGYLACRQPGRTATIVYANSNYEIAESGDNKGPMSQATAQTTGLEQFELASELNDNSPAGVNYGAVGGDIEPGFDPLGASIAVALAEGASSQGFNYYDFGTAGQCPPLGRCQGNWTLGDVAQVSQANDAQAIPEIYFPIQADQWVGVRRAWDQSPACPGKRGHHRRHHRRFRPQPHCFAFFGAMAQPASCPGGSDLAPWQSWTELKHANPLNIVRKHLFFFNPDCISKRKAGGPAPGGFPASVPKRFPETSSPGIAPDPDPLVSSAVMPRIVNGWSVQTHGQVIQVVAGSARSGGGLLAIARRRTSPYSQTLDLVPVPGGGPARITGAPSGAKALAAAGRGVLRVAAEGGVRGELSLNDGSLDLTHGHR